MGKCKPVEQYDLQGNHIATYNSVKEAGEKLGIKPSAISQLLNGYGARNTAGGYKFKYAKKES